MSMQKSLFGLSIFLLAACGQSQNTSATREAWNPANDPLNFSEDYVVNLAALPTEGALDVTPWSDTYWPSNEGGIAARWMEGQTGFRYRTHNKRQIARMSLAERALLSPAEKFDVLNGDYRYPTVKSERNRTSPRSESWEGLCHGWAPAALNFAEPKPILAVNDDGIEIPFGSADIKALLTLYSGNYGRAETRFLGSRCNADLQANPDLANRPECRDTNAGAFHVVLVNQIALLKEGFTADVTRDQQVWNQPVHAFSTRIVRFQEPSEGAARGTVQEAVIETRMTYTVEIQPVWEAVVDTDEQANHSAIYKYRVELNEAGEIIGGEWMQSPRPDFLWTQGAPEFTGRFAKLADLYELSQTAETLPNPVQ